MCGIVGYVGSKPLVPLIMEGLRKLEYRGYDSAGIAVVRNGDLEIRRSAGKLSRLDRLLSPNWQKRPLSAGARARMGPANAGNSCTHWFSPR